MAQAGRASGDKVQEDKAMMIYIDGKPYAYYSRGKWVIVPETVRTWRIR